MWGICQFGANNRAPGARRTWGVRFLGEIGPAGARSKPRVYFGFNQNPKRFLKTKSKAKTTSQYATLTLVMAKVGWESGRFQVKYECPVKFEMLQHPSKFHLSASANGHAHGHHTYDHHDKTSTNMRTCKCRCRRLRTCTCTHTARARERKTHAQ